RGADKIADVLGWSEEAGVEIVTLWMLSTDNLHRDPDEVAELLEIIAGAVDTLADSGRWRLRVVGALELLPEPVAQRLARAEERTADVTGMGSTSRWGTADATRSRPRCARSWPPTPSAA